MANSGRPPSPSRWGRLTGQPFAHQTTAWESLRPAADDDAKRAARSQTDSVCGVCPPQSFYSLPASQPRDLDRICRQAYACGSTRSSDSSYYYIPDPIKSSRSTQPSRQPWAGTNSLTSSMQRVTNVSASAEPPQRQEQVRVGLLRNADSNRSESQTVDLPSGAQTSAGHQVHISHPPKDPTGEKATYNAKVDLLRANSNKSESHNVELASVAHPSARQQVHLPSPSKDPQGEKIRYQGNADLPRGASSSRSGSQNFDPPSVTQTSARHQIHLSPPPKDPAGEKATHNADLKEDMSRKANSNKPESQIVDLPSVAHPSSEQQAHLSPSSKDLPASGQSLASAPKVTKSSRRMQDTALGEPQAPHIETPPEVPAYPNEGGEPAPPDKKGGHDVLNSGRQPAPNDTLGVSTTLSSRPTQDTAPGEFQPPLERTPLDPPSYPNASRECVPPDKKGSHDPLNRQRASNDVSSPPVRHPPATEPPPRCQPSH
jgi:hypothetical protein